MKEMTDKSLSLKTKFPVTSADTDMYARIRLGGLVNFLIQSAIQSADDLGFGFGGIRKQQLFWVLSRLTMEIYRPLKWYEEVEVETWPKNVERILYLRDYILRDKDNQVVAQATSGWLAVDLENHRPKRIEGVEADFFTHLKDKHALEQAPEKLDAINQGEKLEFQSTYFDIDLNKHVTAARYIDWMMDTFSIGFHEQHYPRKLSINYLKETMPREKILLKRKQDQNNRYCFEGFNTMADTTAFRGKIDF
jgi:acyl-ACP thioesterase